MVSTNDEWKVSVEQHPGSSQEDIDNEPDWGKHKHDHYIGYKSAHGRKPGFTPEADDSWEEEEVVAHEAQHEYNRVKREEKAGHLVNFQEALCSEKDLHLDHPEKRSLVLLCGPPAIIHKASLPALQELGF